MLMVTVQTSAGYDTSLSFFFFLLDYLFVIRLRYFLWTQFSPRLCLCSICIYVLRLKA